LLDLFATAAGLSLGLPEAGPVARRVMLLVGIPGYAALEAAIVLSSYYILRKMPHTRPWAALAALGPWLAGWANLYHILGVLGRG